MKVCINIKTILNKVVEIYGVLLLMLMCIKFYNIG